MEFIYSVLSQDYDLKLAFSVSYFCLFVVRTLYNYEVMFRTGILLVAILGPLYPLLYGLPYFFILWRVFVGLNVATDQKLFIGRHTGNSGKKLTEQDDMNKADFSGSTTFNHWVVVIQDGSRFFYTHAVGAVVSGKGKKKPFKEIDEKELHKKYSLNHIGFVTRKKRETKLNEVVDFEPMVSGNSCQEYAVDIAFQISGSRTYTFVKIMALPRFRNTLFHGAVLLSTILTVLDYPYARVFNPLVLTNVFATWELSRIGIHNEPQGAYLPVIRAYLRYPTKWNFVMLISIFALMFYLYHCSGIDNCVVVTSVLFMIVLVWLK